MTPITLTPQKSRYAVPVAVAVAAHTLLFFGFAPPVIKTQEGVNRSVPPSQPYPEPVAWELPKPNPDPDAREVGARRQISAAPTAPEFVPEVIQPSDFTMPLVAAPSGPIDPKLMVAPGEPPQFGALDGVSRDFAALGLVDLDNVPRVTFQARPDYPYTLRHQGISGEVVVNFLVDEQGRVHDVRVIRSSHPDFEQSAVRAVGKWRFESGKRNGRAVRFRMSQAISYALGD